RSPRYRLAPGSQWEDFSAVERYLYLAKREKVGKPIRWETQNLRERPRSGSSVASDEALERTTQATGSLVNSAASVKISRMEEPPQAITYEASLCGDDFTEYESLGESSVASVATDGNLLRATLAEHAIFWNAKRDFYGTSSFVLQANAPSECVIVVPGNCRLLEARADGTRRRAESLGEGRWRVDLDATRFGKRLEVVFQGRCDKLPKAFSFWGRRNAVFSLAFPQIENVTPSQTLWSCAFEDFAAADAWRVYGVIDGERTAEIVCSPVEIADAAEIFLRYRVGRQEALVESLKNDAAFLGPNDAVDFQSRYDGWRVAWDAGAREIDALLEAKNSANALSERQKRAIFAPDPDSTFADAQSARPVAPTDRWTRARYQELCADKRELARSRGLQDSPSPSAGVISPQGIWTLERGAKSRFLFGRRSGAFDRIEIVAPPRKLNFVQSNWATTVFILACVAIFLNLCKTEAKSRFFKSAVFGTLATGAAIAFFAFDWRAAGTLVVLALAILPPIFTRATGRAEPESVELETDEDDDSGEVLPNRPDADDANAGERHFEDVDVGTTASAQAAPETTAE
ncbi:MAG: hypothetical protein HUK22_06695, partial [Thermoguttaceae bacterium]|nr:hypothetical protein [Thermoguttaceae bacterium]